MIRTLSTLLFLTSFTFAAPVPRVKDEGPYLPLVEGTKRVVESSLGGSPFSEHTETVTKVETKGGEHTVTLLAESELPGRLPTPTVFVVTADGLSKREGTAEAVLVFKNGLKAGDSWKDERKEAGKMVLWATYTVGKEEEIEVPAGKFTTVPVIREQPTGGKETTWYARGVGVVKFEGTVRGIAATTALKSFTPGKDAKK